MLNFQVCTFSSNKQRSRESIKTEDKNTVVPVTLGDMFTDPPVDPKTMDSTKFYTYMLNHHIYYICFWWGYFPLGSNLLHLESYWGFIKIKDLLNCLFLKFSINIFRPRLTKSTESKMLDKEGLLYSRPVCVGGGGGGGLWLTQRGLGTVSP